jgi:thiosulfate reductase cytochrome b subunit
LRFHWLCAYLLMLNGLVYLAGLCLGSGWRSLLPRLSDARGALEMARYYLSLPYTILTRRQPIHPNFRTKYNPLQRLSLHGPRGTGDGCWRLPILRGASQRSIFL